MTIKNRKLAMHPATLVLSSFLLILIGGLGVMTISVALFTWISRSILIRQRLAMQDLLPIRHAGIFTGWSGGKKRRLKSAGDDLSFFLYAVMRVASANTFLIVAARSCIVNGFWMKNIPSSSTP